MLARTILSGVPFYGWRLVAAAIIVAALADAEAMTQYGASLWPWPPGSPPLSALLTPSLLLLPSLLLTPAAGWLISRRFGARRAMLLGLPVAGVGLTAAGLWGGVTGYLVTLPLVAIGTTLGGWLPAVTVINEQFRRRPATALAMLILGATLVGSLPALAGGPRALLIASGILTLVVAFPLAWRMPDPPGADTDADDGKGNGDEHPGQTARNAAAGPMPAYAPEYTLRAALRSRDFWLLLAGGGCIQVAITAGLFAMVHLPGDPGATLPLSAYLAASVLSVLAIPAGGLLGDRMPLRRALTLLALTVLAGLAGMTLAGNGVVFALAIIPVRIGSGGIGPPETAALGAYFGRRNFALLLGVRTLFAGVIAQIAIIGIAGLAPHLMLNAGVVAGMAGALAYNAMGHPQPPPAPGGSGPADSGRRAEPAG